MNWKETTAPTVQNNNGMPDEHLCYIVSQGFNISDEQSYLELTTDSKFRCGHCGRQAGHDRNLCVPMEL
ncbi:MAG: hypothetical protein ACYSWW_26525 [Planctomycetota bacterium]|jgi:hypothetical protein